MRGAWLETAGSVIAFAWHGDAVRARSPSNRRLRPDRDDAGRIYEFEALVIVMLDVEHVDRLGDRGPASKLRQIARKPRIVGDAPEVAFEQPDIDRIEPKQRDEQPPVGLGDALAAQEPPGRQPRLQHIERLEQGADSLVIGALRLREAG